MELLQSGTKLSVYYTYISVFSSIADKGSDGRYLGNPKGDSWIIYFPWILKVGSIFITKATLGGKISNKMSLYFD